MIRIGMLLPALACLVIVLGVAQNALAIGPIPRYFSYELRPVDTPEEPGPVNMAFSFEPTDMCEDCNQVTVTVTTKNGLVFVGAPTWTVQMSKGEPYSTVFQVNIPPHDTSALLVRMQCGRRGETAFKYFVTTGSTVEVWSGSPRHHAGRKKPTPPDTTKYEIRIDLREPFRLEHMRNVEEFLNEPLRADGDSGFFRFRADKRLIRKLFGEKFGVELLEEVPGLQVPPPKQDSSDSPKSAPDSTDVQGSIQRSPQLSTDIHVWLDSVDGLMGNGFGTPSLNGADCVGVYLVH